MKERFRTRLAYRIAPWLRGRHRHQPTLSENAPHPESVVWRFDFVKSIIDYPQGERDLMIAFLEDHDIGYIAEGTSIFIVAKDDGTRWVDTWRLVTGQDGEVLAAADVPNALRQERIQVPLLAEPPEMTDARLPERLSSGTVVHSTAAERKRYAQLASPASA